MKDPRASDALKILFSYSQEVFKGPSANILEASRRLDREKEATNALLALSENPSAGVGHLHAEVQRLIYEKMLMLIDTFMASPSMPLSDECERCKSDDALLPLLIRSYVTNAKLPPRSMF